VHPRIIVPVKRLINSKARLTHFLSLGNRKNLTLTMLEHVLATVNKVTADVVVIGSDHEVKDLSAKHGALFELDKTSSLNHAITQAINRYAKRDSDSVLVVAADLPFLKRREVSKLLEIIEDESVIVCPSKDCGTNALFLHPPKAIPLRFGQDSFAKHLQETIRRSRRFKIYWSPGFSFDVDTPKDLQVLKRRSAFM